MADDLVVTMRKNAAEDLQVRWSTFGGRRLLDVRVSMRPALPGPGPTPTRKGLALSSAQWRELLPLIAAAVEGEPGGARDAGDGLEPDD